MKHNNILSKFKFKGLSLVFSFTIMSCVIVLLTVSAFIFYTFFNIKNIVAAFDGDVFALRYSVSTLLIQVLSVDTKRDEYSTTQKVIEILKNSNLLSYIYVVDSKTGTVVFTTETNDLNQLSDKALKQSDKIQKNVIDIGNYQVIFGIQTETNMQSYYEQYFKNIPNIVVLLIVFCILISYFMSSFLTSPIERLCIAANEIKRRNFKIKIAKTYFSEINSLISSYTEMGSQLDELYSSLEKKVQERTSELSKANLKLQETQAMMVHSEKMRSLGGLVAGIAHEINNPINFIHGNIIILQNYVNDLFRLIDAYEENNGYFPQEIKDKLKKLRDDIDIDFLRTDVDDLIRSCMEGTERTKNIILDLKNFSRMEEMVLTQFEISKEIDTTLNILNNKYKNRITVIKNYGADVPKIEAYGGQLNQVFMNILDNAQDAMGESGILKINVEKLDDKVKIEFIDNGSGIPQENLEKVFEPFFTTKPVGKGTGLGMSITYRVIKDHHGTITIDSKVGEGTKFTIILPVNQDAFKKELKVEDEQII